MKTLIVDSATNLLYVSLVVDNDLIYESYIASKHDHASSILVEIKKALTKAQIEIADLDKVIVGVGPGSYTGVRMGVTVGKMIATLKPQIKIYSISTLLLMSSACQGKTIAMIDARRGNCFGCIYDSIKDEYIVEEALVEKETLLANSYDNVVTEDAFKVDAFKVIKLAKLVVEPRTLIPNYLRATEAERNLNA